MAELSKDMNKRERLLVDGPAMRCSAAQPWNTMECHGMAAKEGFQSTSRIMKPSNQTSRPTSRPNQNAAQARNTEQERRFKILKPSAVSDLQ